jgi:hypothetical protein
MDVSNYHFALVEAEESAHGRYRRSGGSSDYEMWVDLWRERQDADTMLQSLWAAAEELGVEDGSE